MIVFYSRFVCMVSIALCSQIVFSQVGIGTTSPLQDLHVAGSESTIRVEGLNSVNNVNNNGIDASVVMVDANGDLFLKDKVDDFPVDANDAGTGTDAFMTSPIVLSDASGALSAAVAYSATITLTRETLVEVAFWTAVNVEQYAIASFPTDGEPRLFGGFVTETGTGTDIVYSANNYTNAVAFGSITTGFFTVGGNGFITLPAGTHTIELTIFASGGDSGEGYWVTFGANAFNRFQIVYHN